LRHPAPGVEGLMKERDISPFFLSPWYSPKFALLERTTGANTS
jgi:hypothetical protein